MHNCTKSRLRPINAQGGGGGGWTEGVKGREVPRAVTERVRPGDERRSTGTAVSDPAMASCPDRGGHTCGEPSVTEFMELSHH